MTCVAYGSFDGIHRGHLKVAELLAKTGKERQLKSILVNIFDETDYLTDEKEKAYLLKETGVDEILTLKEKISIEKLVEDLKIKVLVCGENAAKAAEIEEAVQKYNVELVICPDETENGKLITNNEVREAFGNGDFPRLTKLCGHPYTMIGKVEHGKGLGRKAGMPTANLEVLKGKQKPPSGVYATRGLVDGKYYRAVTNIGRRPSVDNEKRITIETYFLDLNQDLYEKEIIVEILGFIRETKKFDNLEQVYAQIQKDIEVAYSIF